MKDAEFFGSAGLWLKLFTAGAARNDWRNILLREGNTLVDGDVAGFGLWVALQR